MCIYVDFRYLYYIAIPHHVYVLSRDHISCERLEECITCGCFSCTDFIKNNRPNLMMTVKEKYAESQIFSKLLLFTFCTHTVRHNQKSI